MPALRPWQKRSVNLLQGILASSNSAVDASDTGTGKTYVACALVKQLGLGGMQCFILCPKAVIQTWMRVAREFGIDPIAIINPEALKTGKYPWLKRGYDANGKKNKRWVWLLPPGTLLIVDEAHRFSGVTTENAYMLGYARKYGLRTLCLSATIADSPLKLRALGYLLGLHKWTDFYAWCLNHGCYKNPWNGLDFPTGSSRLIYLKDLHEEIFPSKGVRMRIAEIPEFPENQVTAESFDLGMKSTSLVSQAYEEAFHRIQDREYKANPLTEMLKAMQISELQKVDILIEMAQDLLDECRSVVIFVNFRETQKLLMEYFAPRKGVQIHGDQKDMERDQAIQYFQTNISSVLVATIASGGIGISLQDEDGLHPRTSLICPTYSLVNLKQALGRIHRVTGKSKAVQQIIFAAGTIEEDVCKSLQKKLDNLSVFLDGITEEDRLFTGVL